MSDDAEQYYSAWSAVMNCSNTKKLLCAWHVDRAWRSKMNLVKHRDKQEQVYKMLCVIRREPDIEKFKILLQNFMKIIIQPDLLEFGQYFNLHYRNRAKVWAACYRLGSQINTNMHLESMHKVLKYICLKGFSCKRLDKTVHTLLKYVKNKQFERIIKLSKEKNTGRSAETYNRHYTAVNDMKLCAQVVSDHKWIVQSKQKSYSVIKNAMSDHNCNMMCKLCLLCIHKYSCTCMDFVIRGNICKHIHKICLDKNVPERSFTYNNEENVAEMNMHLKTLSTVQNDTTEKIILHIKQKMNCISSKLIQVSEPEVLIKINADLQHIINFINSNMESDFTASFENKTNVIAAKKKI